MISAPLDYPTVIQRVFSNLIRFLGKTDGIHLETVIDSEYGHYLLVEMGWQNSRRIYGTLLHIDIIDNKLWIQHDGTEEGIADELVSSGIPKQNIVLAFKPVERRKITEFAVS